MSPMSPAKARRKSSRSEQALDLALGAFVDVGPGGVEEPDLHAGRVARHEPDGDAALGPLGTDLEPGQGDGGELEVVDVDAREVETRP